MIPTSNHNEALSGDTLYSAFLNYEWREIVLPFIIAGMEQIAAGIADETDRQDFEVLYGAMIDDFYNEDIVDGTPVGMIMAYTNNTAPAKWLSCNGQEVAQATYPELYALIGATFGSAASGNFKLPHINGIQHFIRGFVPPPTAGQEIGVTGGAVNMQLTVNHLPEHHHIVPAHAHTVGTRPAAGSNTGSVSLGSLAASGTIATDAEPATDTSDVGLAFPDPVQTVPPHINMNYVIKALP